MDMLAGGVIYRALMKHLPISNDLAARLVDSVLIDRPEVASSGAGEATLRVIAAAVGNAFFDATGVRLRKAPMNPERVKAALAKA